ncbi:MAG: LamG domain-containing protein [Pseudomonadota bacterium]
MIRETLMNGMRLVRIPVHAMRTAVVLAALGALTACSGGAATQENPVTSAPPTADYTGPAPANADVQAFRVSLWENIKANNRCGGCHGAGGQSPQFARTDDVNLAYQAANTVVTLTQPEESRLVTKVAGGHNCWLASDSACADTLTVWIRNWAGAIASGGRTITLQAPPVKEVGAAKTFPADSSLFAGTVYPLVRAHCARCHASDAATVQSPFFASRNVDEAYAAARSKINLDDPRLSRLVVRLRDEFHNCWGNCEANADEMQTAIEQFADQILPTEVDPSLILSKAVTLYDGTVAAGGNRYDSNVIALYEFKTGTGNVVYDTSGVEPALNLTLSGAYEWVGGWGIRIGAGGKAQGATTASKKLADMIKSTGEFTIEVWAAPANVVQEDAYIVSYSGGAMARNVTLAQRAYQYEAMLRSSETDANGTPSLLTNADDEDAQASLQHVVLTYDPVNGRRIYVNGNFTGDVDPIDGGSLADWDDSFALVFGNETSNNRQWQGVLRLVAIHNRALTEEQIQQNFAAGVGERYYLLFNVSHLVDVPQSYIMFEASQYDSYAYLFTNPTFISLDSGATPGNIPLSGMRIGINGAEARVGQAYVPLETTITASNYSSESGQLLSTVGTVIGLEKGPADDEFFLSFERIGAHTHDVIEPVPPAPEPPADRDPVPDIGVRTFDEINATMSEITGVPVTNAAVAETFATLRQSLPTVESIEAFLSSHQSAVAQLAIKYCSVMVDNPSLRQSFWGGDVSNMDLTTSSGRNAFIDPLFAKIVGGSLENQPDLAELRAELGSATQLGTAPNQYQSLIERLCPGGNCSSARKLVVAKAACGAVLGSGAMLVH